MIGGVRINLVGRESHGRIHRGREYDALCERLEADLRALVNVETGTPVVTRVERSDAHYERSQLDALPDLFVEWNSERPTETIWSPRFGLIRSPYTHWRTGDHKPGGLLLARGPAIPAGASLPSLEIDRLGDLLASHLGVELGPGHELPAPSLSIS